VDSEDDPGPAIGTTGARFGGASRRKRTARRKTADASPAPEPPEAPASEADTVAIPVVPDPASHHAGARQHGAPAADAAPPADPAPAGDAPDDPAVGLTGARFGGARKRKPRPRPAAPEPEPTPAPPPLAPPEPPVPPGAEEPVGGGSAIVRPYVLTRGRTRPAFELSVETLVSAVPHGARTGLTGEHHAVLGLCGEPCSVAELAAHVGVPLGVARVLVGDLAAAGAVAVHRGPGASGPDLALMERVLSGLRKL
jgi:hypothetical protein